jgi:uncharacterized RDD family membrane protein YckC
MCQRFKMLQSSRTNVLVIRTPEGIAFPLLLAGPVIRFLAWFMDAACITVGAIASRFIFSAIGLVNEDFANALSVLFYFFLSIGYPIFTEWRWRGQTVGKRLFHLRVMDVQGLRLQFSQIMIRNLLRFVDSIPLLYAFGGIVCFLSKRAQRLGDIAANTIVVRDPDLMEPDLSQVLAGKYNSFRDYPHLAARLRQRLGVEEVGVALQSVLRRDRLNPEARVELFQQVALHFKSVVEFPPEAVEGLTDEQYVRNVVDLLFEKTTSARKLAGGTPAPL